MTIGPAEVFDLGYHGYDGRAHEPLAAAPGDLARRRSGSRSASGGAPARRSRPWLLIALALVPDASSWSWSPRSSASLGGDAANDFDLPSYAEYYEFAIVPIGAVRRDRRAAAHLPRPPGRCALALRGPADHDRPTTSAARWAAFLTVAAARDVAAGGAPLRLVRRWTHRAPARGSRTTGTSCRGSCSPAAWSRSYSRRSPSSLRRSPTRRAYAAVATLAVIVVGSAVGGIAENNFTGRIPDVLSLAALPHVLVDTVHWIFGDDLSQRPLSGRVDAAWLLVLTAMLALGLLHRTRRQVRA